MATATSILGKIAGDTAGGLIGGIGTLVEKVRTAITGAEALSSESRAQIETHLIQLEAKLLELQARVVEAQQTIIVSEAQGGSWLQRNWRPLTMLTFVSLVVAHWLGFTATNLTPEERLKVMDIIQLGLGGYVIGRSVEKSVKYYSERSK